MRFQEFKLNLLEASGGMWDRMAERRSGKPIVFAKGDRTLDLIDVQVFPQDPKITSYKDLVTAEPQAKTSAKQPAKTEPQWKGRQQPTATAAVAPVVPVVVTPDNIDQQLEVPAEQDEQERPEAIAEDAPVANASHTQVMLDDILQWINSQGASVEYAQPPKNSDAAAMVVILGGTDENGVVEKLAFVNWYLGKKNKVPPIFWKTIRFEEATGWVQGSAGKSATSKAALLRIDPSDLLDANQTYDIAGVPSLVATGRLATRTDIPRELVAGVPAMLDDLLNNASPVPTQDLEKYERELEVVLGETAAPIALMTGNRVSGAYDEVTTQLLEPMGLTWGDFTNVTYGKKGGKVEDCSVYAGETKLMVSSKDSGGGAPASLTGFMETLGKYPDQFGPNTKFAEQYADILNVLQTLHTRSSMMGILMASRNLGFIDDQELQYILEIYGRAKGSMKDAKRFPNLATVLKAKGIKGSTITNAKGEKVVSKQGVDVSNFKYQFGYHLMGNLAVMLQKHFAKDQDRVTKMFKSVLNRADMVQVYTKVGKSNQGLWFEDFKVTWPPTFDGKIVIIADHYTANAPAAKKISFYFK
jgi:hypothetical protein